MAKIWLERHGYITPHMTSHHMILPTTRWYRELCHYSHYVIMCIGIEKTIDLGGPGGAQGWITSTQSNSPGKLLNSWGDTCLLCSPSPPPPVPRPMIMCMVTACHVDHFYSYTTLNFGRTLHYHLADLTACQVTGWLFRAGKLDSRNWSKVFLEVMS